MPSNHLILCCPRLLLPSIFPSIRVFCNESALLIRWPKYWSFSFSISPSSEYPGLISFRMDWLDLLAVQGILESSPAPQFKSINSSVLSLLYSPALTAIHDYWKNHSLVSVLLRLVHFCITWQSVQFSSVTQSCPTLSDPHVLQHTRPPCPSPTPGVYSNLCSLSQGCHPAISSSVVRFSSCRQSFPASGSFQ